MLLSKKFSLVSSFITGPTKQNPNMASVHTLNYKDGRQRHPRKKMTTCSLVVTKNFEIARWITCYFYSKQVILLCRHRQRPVLGRRCYNPKYRILEHFRLFSLLHYHNNFKMQSSVWHSQLASWKKWEQDPVLTKIITSVLYFH